MEVSNVHVDSNYLLFFKKLNADVLKSSMNSSDLGSDSVIAEGNSRLELRSLSNKVWTLQTVAAVGRPGYVRLIWFLCRKTAHLSFLSH